jgi:hypothetical protein
MNACQRFWLNPLKGFFATLGRNIIERRPRLAGSNALSIAPPLLNCQPDLVGAILLKVTSA